MRCCTIHVYLYITSEHRNALDIGNDAVNSIFMQDSGSDGVDISTFMKFDDPNNPLLQAAKEPLAFDYSDSDSLLKELGDLYSYTELGDFARNRLSFQQHFERHTLNGPSATWIQLNQSEQDAFVKDLLRMAVVLDASSSNDTSTSMQSLRAMLYLAQGSFSTDLPKVKDSIIEKRIRRNVRCLYRNGIWPVLLHALQHETEKSSLPAGEGSAQKQSVILSATFCLKDSISLRTILNLMYIIVEVLRRPTVTVPEPPTTAPAVGAATATGASNNSMISSSNDPGNTSLSSSGVALPTFDVPVSSNLLEAAANPAVEGSDESDGSDDADSDADEDEFNTFREQFVEDLRTKCMPHSDSSSNSDRETLIIFLVKMLRLYIDGNHPHFSIKKILLLLWKCLLTSLGGFSDLRRLKEEKRMEKGLPPGLEDTLEVAKRMCSSSPPMTGVEMLAAEIGRRSNIPSGNLLSMSGGGLILNKDGSNDGRKVQPQRRLTGIMDAFSQHGIAGENNNGSKTADASLLTSMAGGPAAKRRAMLRRSTDAPRASSLTDDDGGDVVDSHNTSKDALGERKIANENDISSGASANETDIEKQHVETETVNNYDEIGATTIDLHVKSPEKIPVRTNDDDKLSNLFGDVSSVNNDDDNNNIIDEEEAQRLAQLVKNKRKRSFEEEVANEFNEKMPPSAEDEIDEDDVLLEQDEDENDSTKPPSNEDDISNADDAEIAAGQQKKVRKSSGGGESFNENLKLFAESNKKPSSTTDSNSGAVRTGMEVYNSDADDDCSSEISSLASSVFSIREFADEKKLIERPLREVSHLKRLRFTPKVRQQDVYRWLSRVRTKLAQHQQQPEPPAPSAPPQPNGSGAAQQTSNANGSAPQQNSSPSAATNALAPHIIPRPIQFFQPPFPPYSRIAQYINMDFAQWNSHMTAGLPHSALGSYNVLQRYLYYSLSEVYLQEELDMTAYPYAVGMQLYPRPTLSFIEQLYVELLEEMPIFIVSLIRCIIAAGPSHKQQAGIVSNQQQKQQAVAQVGAAQINVVSDMMPSDISPDIVEKLGIDVSRHKEIIMKACTFVLLLLMKHLKVNNTFQFEYMSILMVQGNGIALMMRFLNQNLIEYVEQINCVPQLEYPQCVFGPSRSSRKINKLMDAAADPLAIALREYPVEPMPTARNYLNYMLPDAGENSLSTDRWRANSIGGSSSSSSGVVACGNQSILDLPSARRFSSRNLYTTVNMLRIMQKLTKWKYARTLCLLHFKSQAKLKPLLRIRCPLLQVYVLKLLKCQVRYLGRQWRKSNMKIISAIYSKVRHRLSDEWAFGHVPMSEPELKTAIEEPRDEHALRAMVDEFNKRHYPNVKPRMPTTATAPAAAAVQPITANETNTKLLAAVTRQADLGANVWDMPSPWEIIDKLTSNSLHMLSSSSSLKHDLLGEEIAERGDEERLLVGDDDLMIFSNNITGADGDVTDNNTDAGDEVAWLSERFRSNLDIWVEEEVMKKHYNWEELLVNEASDIVQNGSSL